MDELYVEAEQIVWHTHAHVYSQIAYHLITETKSLSKWLDPGNRTTLLGSVEQMLILH